MLYGNGLFRYKQIFWFSFWVFNFFNFFLGLSLAEASLDFGGCELSKSISVCVNVKYSRHLKAWAENGYPTCWVASMILSHWEVDDLIPLSG